MQLIKMLSVVENIILRARRVIESFSSAHLSYNNPLYQENEKK